MSVEEPLQNTSSRLGPCEVCANTGAKYTCPECEVKTCCLPCVKIHKKELNCSGVRNKVKYKSLNQFRDFDLQSDYMLLEDTGRVIESISKESRQFLRNRKLSCPLSKLKAAAGKRGVRLDFLPQKFSRHRNNTTYLNWATDSLYWRVELVFPNASNLHVYEKRVLDTEKISSTVEKYISPDKCDVKFKEALSLYHQHDPSKISVLLKAEKQGGTRFFLVETSVSLREMFVGKVIIENPIFYVIFTDQIDDYQVLVSDDEEGTSLSNTETENFFFNEVGPGGDEDGSCN